MRGKTLEKLIDDLRAETRLSLNPAHNANDRELQVKHLQRTQEWLWDDYDWPHLRVERNVPIQAGQRYYDFPADLALDRVEKLEYFADGAWCRLQPGIEGAHYSMRNSELDEREWPPRRWRLSENEDFEVWPISDRAFDPATQDGQLKFTGIRNLKKLVDDADRADLDDRIIVLFAAAERLAAVGAKDAKLKQDMALKRFARLRGELQITRRFRMFGTGERNRSRFGLPIGSGGGAYVPPTTPQLTYPLEPIVVEVPGPVVDTPDIITPVSGEF